jgi:hypothetical protein
MVTQLTASWDEVLDAVIQETLRVRYAWGNYRYLFVETEHRVNVLNATASDFFAWVQGLAVDTVFMGIARLTDRGSTGRQENASLDRLLTATQWQTSDFARWQMFNDRLTAVQASCASCRHYRHKRLGHFDLSIALNVEAVPAVTVREVDSALDSIERFLGEIHLELRPDHAQSFRFIDGEAHAKRLMDKLTNRMSRTRSDAISTIVRGDDEEGTRLRCGFCDQSAQVWMLSDDVPDGRYLKHWHFDKCPGLIGVETVTVEMSNDTGTLVRRTFALNQPS